MKIRFFTIGCCLIAFLTTSSLYAMYNNRTYFPKPLVPTNFCLSYIALTPSNNAISDLTRCGYIHDILLLLVRQALQKNTSPNNREKLLIAESIFAENLAPFLVAVPIGTILFRQTDAWSILEKLRRNFQSLKQ